MHYQDIISRVLTEFVQDIETRIDTQFIVGVSSMEDNNEGLHDLLSTVRSIPPSKYPLLLATAPDDDLLPSSELVDREAPNIVEDTQGPIFVQTLRCQRVYIEEDALNLLFKRLSNRTTAMKQSRHMSSRSHVVFTVFLKQHSRIDVKAGVITSKLHLIDLVGSERDPLGKATSGLSPQQLQKEAQSINLSLTLLEQVIVALGDKKRDHIQFRSLMLTSLLKDVLGGNCRTTLICNNTLTGRGRVKNGQEEQKSMNESGKAKLVWEATYFVSGEIDIEPKWHLFT
ncbi:putative kinesin family member 9 [Blattamonas nauphoetae]|uniref:Kinesin family member 9 n=1 Tax=Blattamonas nauphoetae TaxID=2049346 RepID=A0ABQ9X1X0_9EUKA|nr:putative kinesin family member 9 [Blattamonas nauphoetae]